MASSRCPNCKVDLSQYDFSGSHGRIPCPRCGADITDRVKVVDLRSQAVRQAEKDAGRDLGGEDEHLAQAVAVLDSRLKWTRQSPNVSVPPDLRRVVLEICDLAVSSEKSVKDEIRRIGYHLCRNGGDDRMQRVGYRCIALGAMQYTLEYCWSGICGWYNGYAHNFDF